MSSCSSRASCESGSDVDQCPFSVIVLQSGNTYSYTIPSFCAIHMNLLHVVLHVVLQVDGVNNLDAFVRVGNGVPRFDRQQPTRLLVLNGCIVPVSFLCSEYTCAMEVFLFQVSECSLEICIENMQLHQLGVFVIYEWKWEDIDEHVDGSTSEINTPSSHSPSLPSSPIITNAPVTTTPTVTHIITFKCIRAVRDENQQRALEHAFIARGRGETVRVKLEPEPTNAYDSKAIAFMCMVEGSWKRIGYVVRETLDEVHKAIRQRNILWV